MKLIPAKEIEGCKCENVEDPESVKKLAFEMVFFMNKNNGIGLAAPQIGVFKRLFVMKNFRGGGTLVVIDPIIVWKSDKVGTFEESCLSYPGEKVRVKRHKQIKATWRDETGAPVTLKMSGREAQVFQHEYSHLCGRTLMTEEK